MKVRATGEGMLWKERSPGVGMLGACCVGVVGMEMASIYSGEGDGWGEVN